MEVFVYGLLAGIVANTIETEGVRKLRWWIAMLSVNTLVILLRNGF